MSSVAYEAMNWPEIIMAYEMNNQKWDVFRNDGVFLCEVSAAGFSEAREIARREWPGERINLVKVR